MTYVTKYISGDLTSVSTLTMSWSGRYYPYPTDEKDEAQGQVLVQGLGPKFGVQHGCLTGTWTVCVKSA